ncbi:polymeric immunoglobulin receptor-like isoform X1 [Triplophysa dalaica]|uniref:polymeric immunoglobulin receptor-like isoform X1 n=1 Tax=Triplophysa dalaica TaxID=1582913 RepID=UPI0024DF6359|nr:polymeric immunoglobulin receptor-like isoform X1 [Triplophysa dalaica]
MTEYMRRMKMMLTFTLLMIPGALSFSVTGYTGGAVTITCHYESGYSTNAKYFCRLSADLTQKCSDLIKTNITNKWFKSGRFSLYDDTTASVFNVTITDLNEHDSDTYYCAVDRSLWDIYTEVILNVTEDDCCEKIISLSVPSGGSVNVSCKYPQSHRTDMKFLCRSSGADICAHVRQTRDRDHDVLFITNVTDHRSAEYWCALQTEDHRYKIFITRVHITVTDTTDHKTSPPTTTSSSPSSPSSFLSSFPSVQSTLVMTSSSSTFSKNQSAVTSASPERSSDTLLIMSLSVVLVLIIIGLLLMTVILYKRHQTAVTRSQAGPVHKEQISRASCDYTEVKDIRGDEVCSTDSPNTVYAMVQSPTIPSDAIITVYDTAQLPTIPSDFNNTVYSSARLPTIPSVGSDLVRLRNSLDSCEYSTVNHWDT